MRRLWIGLTVACTGWAEADVAKFGWIAGCWENEARGTSTLEIWMKPAGGTMIGMARSIAGGKTTSYEALRIFEKDGSLYYGARLPNAAVEVPFKLVKGTDGEAIFENPEHDFPTRIIYRKQPDGGLFARIEGVRNGQLRGRDIPMKRVACP